MAILKFTRCVGEDCAHPGGDDVAGWLDDDGGIFAGFKDEPEKEVIGAGDLVMGREGEYALAL